MYDSYIIFCFRILGLSSEGPDRNTWTKEWTQRAKLKVLLFNLKIWVVLLSFHLIHAHTHTHTHFSWVTGEISHAAFVPRNYAERSTLCKFQPQLIVGLRELMANQISVAHCRCLAWATFSFYGVILKKSDQISAWQLLLFCRPRFSDCWRYCSSVGFSSSGSTT